MPSYKRLDACIFNITWNDLYQKIYCRFTDINLTLIEFEFLKAVYPNDFLEVSLIRNKKFQGKYASLICRATDDARPRFEESRDYLINLRTPDYEKYRYDTCPVITAFQKNWEKLIPILTEGDSEQKQELIAAIDHLLSDIPEVSDPLDIFQRIYPLYESGHYSQVLAILSVMASTLFHFTVNNKKISDADSDLHTLVLPPLPAKEASFNLEKARTLLDDNRCNLEEFKEMLSYSLKSSNEKTEAQYLLYMKAVQFGEKQKYHDYLVKSAVAGFELAMLRQKDEKAEELLRNVVKIYEDPTAVDQTSISKCCRNCEDILRLTPTVSNTYRGPASYILYKYSETGAYTSPSGETAYQFLEISHNCGYAPATTAWEKHNTFSITPTFIPGEETTSGICYFNADNIYSKTFLKTKPESWTVEYDSYSCIFNENLPQRLFLIDDDIDKNLSDLLTMLQEIKNAMPSFNGSRLEIFIRHNSDTARAIIDTAVSHMGNILLPIYIINDDKSAAQQLLSQHPLFYPLKGVKLSETPVSPDEDRPILNFVILGTSDVAEWLIREAFWMMGDKNNAVEHKITLLAPNGEDFIVKLKTKYPGMVKDNFNIQGIEIPDIIGKNINFDSSELLDEVDNIVSESPYCYFSVATPDDEVNLSIAMRIREASIRTYIRNAADTALSDLFPIAFLCREDKIAWLSRSMVIEKENQGNKWFNTWSLIPFGEISNRYSWNEITGGTFQQLALCIHYQYNDIESNESDSEMDSTYEKAYNAKKDFYLRQYNQDSSYSLALSLPYRIFQFNELNGNRVSPIAWGIRDKTVFSTAEQLALLSKRINERFMKPDAWKKIAEWEHARWVRWMLSRGWLSASFDDAVFAFKQGNPRQQLFVARLHPCICSYEDLSELQKVLYEQCNIKKDFYTADLINVKATKRILSLEWIASPAKESDR
ncbi:MAG: hypothetical protein Q4F28_10850 [Eubacteriales bacterium]|nr:hypothetical protein [Eubacteriales bacterium]